MSIQDDIEALASTMREAMQLAKERVAKQQAEILVLKAEISRLKEIHTAFNREPYFDPIDVPR